MPELRQEYLNILEKREWSVSGYTDDGRVELEWWSPATRRSATGETGWRASSRTP